MDNKNFWNNRYKTNINLGSGTGSRGANRNMKSNLFKQILNEYEIDSVLDIGCGDGEVTKDVEFKNYLGVDISDYIIERNSSLYSNREYKNMSFDDILRDNIKKDLVICFDVLIHQPTKEEYDKGIQTIKESFNKVALVSGFDKGKTQGIVFFYENIIDSFSEYKVEVITRFDIQVLIKITKV